jgi:hypothetical protein
MRSKKNNFMMPDKQPGLLVSIIFLSDTVYEKKTRKLQFLLRGFEKNFTPGKQWKRKQKNHS